MVMYTGSLVQLQSSDFYLMFSKFSGLTSKTKFLKLFQQTKCKSAPERGPGHSLLHLQVFRLGLIYFDWNCDIFRIRNHQFRNFLFFCKIHNNRQNFKFHISDSIFRISVHSHFQEFVFVFKWDQGNVDL